MALQVRALSRSLVFATLAALALIGCGKEESGPTMIAGPEDQSGGDDVRRLEDLVVGPDLPAEDKLACVPECFKKQCGPNGCDGVCGLCGIGTICSPDFQCIEVEVCTPGTAQCQEGGLANCLNDGSGWSAPVPCPAGYVCDSDSCKKTSGTCQPGQTACQGNAVITCLADGVTWSAPVDCWAGTACKDGVCQVKPDVTCQQALYCMFTKNCGDPQPACMPECLDGTSEQAKALANAVYQCIFQQCGKWGPNEPCFQTSQFTNCASQFAACKQGSCVADCAGKQCGPDGCGGQCGACGAGTQCNATGQCVPTGPACAGITWEGCCDGSLLKYCENDQLVTVDCSTQPQCGWAFDKYVYDCWTTGKADPSGVHAKACPGSCVGSCDGKQCGDDGCGGSCGACAYGLECKDGLCTEDYGCSDMVNCALGCGFSTQCVMGCYGAGDQASQQLFNQLITCIVDTCGYTIKMECILGAIGDQCAQKYNTCMAD